MPSFRLRSTVAQDKDGESESWCYIKNPPKLLPTATHYPDWFLNEVYTKPCLNQEQEMIKDPIIPANELSKNNSPSPRTEFHPSKIHKSKEREANQRDKAMNLEATAAERGKRKLW
jgi:hypothetical protein